MLKYVPFPFSDIMSLICSRFSIEKYFGTRLCSISIAAEMSSSPVSCPTGKIEYIDKDIDTEFPNSNRTPSQVRISVGTSVEGIVVPHASEEEENGVSDSSVGSNVVSETAAEHSGEEISQQISPGLRESPLSVQFDGVSTGERKSEYIPSISSVGSNPLLGQRSSSMPFQSYSDDSNSTEKGIDVRRGCAVRYSPKESEEEEETDKDLKPSFSMHLYKKSPFYQPQPERCHAVNKTLAASASKGSFFYDSRSSYYKHLFSQVFELTSVAKKLGIDISHLSHLTSLVLSFMSIEKDKLLYLRTQLESILGENYFDESDTADCSDMEWTTDEEKDHSQEGSEVELDINSSSEYQSSVHSHSECDLPLNLGQKGSPSSIDSPAPKDLSSGTVEVPSETNGNDFSPQLAAAKSVSSSTGKATQTTCVVTCSTDTAATLSTNNPHSGKAEKIRTAVAELPAELPAYLLPTLNTPEKPGQEFRPRRENDKPYVMGYYVMKSDGCVIELELHSKELKEKYDQVNEHSILTISISNFLF